MNWTGLFLLTVSTCTLCCSSSKSHEHLFGKLSLANDGISDIISLINRERLQYSTLRDISSAALSNEDIEENIESSLPCLVDAHLSLRADRWLPRVCQEESTMALCNDELKRANSAVIVKTTGTTIVGLVVHFPENNISFCVLAADTRATTGSLVADRRADKLHRLGPWACAAGAGTSADLDHLTRECYYHTKLQARLEQMLGYDGTSSTDAVCSLAYSVRTIASWLQQRLLQEKGSCQANLILGGVDSSKGHAKLMALHPHGSVDSNLQYTALGSGGMAALGVLERDYVRLVANLTDVAINQDEIRQAAVRLAVRAVRAGIINDLGSGSQVDVCVISCKEGATYTWGQWPEDTLPGTNSTLEELKSPSVNGFGSVPFAIKATRQVRLSTPDRNRQLAREFEEVLP